MESCCDAGIVTPEPSRKDWLMPLLGGILVIGIGTLAVAILVGVLPGTENLDLAPLRTRPATSAGSKSVSVDETPALHIVAT